MGQRENDVRFHGRNYHRVAKSPLTFALRQVLIFRALRTRHAPGKKVMDTVGELKSAEMCVFHMPSWKAKKLGNLTQEKVLLEP